MEEVGWEDGGGRMGGWKRYDGRIEELGWEDGGGRMGG